jgi:hypothetical protein
VCEAELKDGAAQEIIGDAYGRPYNAQRPSYGPTVELMYLRHPDGSTGNPRARISQETAPGPNWMGRDLGRRLVTELLLLIRAVPLPLADPSKHNPSLGE